VTRLDFALIAPLCLLILGIALCARAARPANDDARLPNSDARPASALYNFDVPLHGCAEKVTLVGCDYKATHCQTSRIKFHSPTCLTVEAQ
jgi:hypothetical protein